MAEQTDKKNEQSDKNTVETTPLYKKWWFILIIVLILAAAGYFGMGMMKKPQQSFAYYF